MTSAGRLSNDSQIALSFHSAPRKRIKPLRLSPMTRKSI